MIHASFTLFSRQFYPLRGGRSRRLSSISASSFIRESFHPHPPSPPLAVSSPFLATGTRATREFYFTFPALPAVCCLSDAPLPRSCLEFYFALVCRVLLPRPRTVLFYFRSFPTRDSLSPCTKDRPIKSIGSFAARQTD